VGPDLSMFASTLVSMLASMLAAGCGSAGGQDYSLTVGSDDEGSFMAGEGGLTSLSVTVTPPAPVVCPGKCVSLVAQWFDPANGEPTSANGWAIPPVPDITFNPSSMPVEPAQYNLAGNGWTQAPQCEGLRRERPAAVKRASRLRRAAAPGSDGRATPGRGRDRVNRDRATANDGRAQLVHELVLGQDRVADGRAAQHPEGKAAATAGRPVHHELDALELHADLRERLHEIDLRDGGTKSAHEESRRAGGTFEAHHHPCTGRTITTAAPLCAT
jgi:hypothetical protein